MNTKLILGSLAGLIALVGITACGGGDENGGGDNQTGGIRTQKGLALANIAAGQDAGAGGGNEVTGAEPAADLAQSGTRSAQTGSNLGFAPRDSIGYGGGFAPEIYPFQQAGSNGITVQGYASASADADGAIAEFYFYSDQYGIFPGGFPSGGPASSPEPVDQITEDTLKPVIDAIAGQGVSGDDMEFISSGYYDKFSSSATLRVTVRDLGLLDGVVDAATNAAAGLQGIALQSSNVSYTVADCAAIESAAMKAAVEDANDRAATFAQALGVGLGAVTGASNYSYYGGTPCDSGFYKGPYPLGGVGYFEGQPREVQVLANISVTFAIQ